MVRFERDASWTRTDHAHPRGAGFTGWLSHRRGLSSPAMYDVGANSGPIPVQPAGRRNCGYLYQLYATRRAKAFTPPMRRGPDETPDCLHAPLPARDITGT